MNLLNTSHTKKIHQRIAPHYEKHAVLQRLVEHELLSRLDIISLDINHVLNMGCGTGSSTKSLARTFPNATLTMLDHSELMLKHAKKHKPWFKKIQYLNDNAKTVSLSDDSIDLLISNLMLPACPEPDLIFAQVQRITRENGLFTFSTLGPDSFKELRAASVAAGITHHDQAFGHLTDMHDLGDGLVRAGLREPVMDVDYFTLTFSHFDDLWKELDNTGNIFQSFSEKDKQAISSHYQKDSKNQNLEVTFEVVYGQAWAGDGLRKARTPDEVTIPVANIGKRTV